MKNQFVKYIVLLNLLILINATTGCKKPKELVPRVTQVEPESFFPCYPGSNWLYLDSLGKEIVLKVEDQYQPYQIKVPDDSLSDLYLLPRIENNYYYGNYKIYDTPPTYDIEYSSTHKSDSFEKIVVLSNSENERIFVEYYSGHHFPGSVYQSNYFISFLDTFYIGNRLFKNVVVNQVSKTYSGYGAQGLNIDQPFPSFIRFYAQDIGLILEKVIYNAYTIPDTIVNKTIVSYHINKN